MGYQTKPLSCDPARIKGMSERLIVSHYENNYGGAVKRLNLIEEKLAELDYAKAPVFFGSILVLFFVPWLDTSSVRSARFRPIYRQFFWLFLIDCILLGYAGGQPPQGVWLVLSRIGAAYYFLHFFVVLPVVGLFERPREVPISIRQPAESSP